MDDAAAELDDALERPCHVGHPEVGQREAVARPAAPLVQAEGRPVAVGLDPLALPGLARRERDPEQPLPEGARAAQVVGRELDQIERHHPFSLCRRVRSSRYRREPMSPFEVRELVRRLQAAYPEPPLAEETEKLYERMLVDLDFAAVDPVVDELIATTMKLPTVSRIRRAVIEPTLEIPTADEAWLAVQTREGATHELVAHVARLVGGGYNIRTSSDPELTRVRFVKVYDELRRKAVDRALAEGVRAQRMNLQQAS